MKIGKDAAGYGAGIASALGLNPLAKGLSTIQKINEKERDRKARIKAAKERSERAKIWREGDTGFY